MEPRRVAIAPFVHACEACGLSAGDLGRVADHVEHVARRLSALEQRRIRSHLFAVLAALTGTIDLTE